MKRLLLIVAATAVWTASGQGTFEAIQGYGTVLVGSLNGTVGGILQVTNHVTVTELGAFDYLFDNNPAIQVGLWDSSGNLLASNTITPSSALVGESRYESITPVSLDVGQIYHLGAFATNGTIYDLRVGGLAGYGPVVTAPEIVLGDSAYTAGGFTSPADEPGTLGAFYLGPNFQFESTIPEPASGLLLGLAGLVFAANRCSSRSSKPAGPPGRP